MFMKHRVTAHPTSKMLNICELFKSIQGESTYTGQVCSFIRLSGCNLHCSYCDTQYALEKGEDLAVDEIIARVDSFGSSLIEITGGEPLLQAEVPELCCQLLDRHYTVLVETNGTQDISRVDERCVKIVDMKCPSSGQSDKNDLVNLDRLNDHDELKFVMGTREDYVWAKSILEKVPGYPEKPRNIFFSCVFDKLAPSTVVDWILQDNLNVRLQLQMHKYIWHPEKTGV